MKNFLIIIFLSLFGSVYARYIPSQGNRLVINFNQNWKFIREDQPQAFNPEFNDSAWQNVGLPHTYNEFDIFDQFSPRLGDSGWGGVTWYRKRFSVDAGYQDKMVYLEIAAARTVADVWINGHKVGDTYYSGFSSFAMNLTPYLNFGPGKTNVIAVRVDDTEGEKIAPGNFSQWHPVYGGLYSNVNLHVTDKLHVSLPFYSFLKTEGTYIGTPKVTASGAQYRITTEIKNNYPENKACELITTIVDASGKVVSSVTAKQTIGPGATFKFDQTGNIKKPQLWSPNNPYLYNAYSTVKIGKNVVDVYKTTFGVRTIEWDLKTKMFTINGQPLLLQGWGQKPTNEYASLGPAIPDWLHAMDIRLMKDAGGNIIRWGHCAGLPIALDEGDRIGVMQWQPNLSGESDYTGVVYERKMIGYRDILIRDRNHPSIVLWEGNNRPGDLNSGHTKAWRDIVYVWDWITPRPYSVRRPSQHDTTECAYVDVSIETNNENRYCPSLPRVESEFYRPEPPRRYWDEDSPLGEHPDRGYGRTQRRAMKEIVDDWKSISSRGGGVKWHFSDACTLGRCPHEVTRGSGVVDGMHIPKDIYYAFKAIWRDDPQVHIMGHWNYAGNHTIDVYSNCEEVELFVNNISQGKQKPAVGRCSWPDISFQAGTIKAVGLKDGAVRCSDERKTAGEPDHIALSVIKNPKGMKADRSDVALIDAVIVDAQGNVCPLADHLIKFTVKGPGSYRGGYNTYKESTPGKDTLNAEAGRIRVGIRSTNVPGTITVEATAVGIKPGIISFTTVEADKPKGITEVEIKD